MRLIGKVKYEDLKVEFVSNYYDGPLSGLCKFGDRLCYFQLLDWERKDWEYEIYDLTFKEKSCKLINKKVFEWCVGYHWTYKEGKRTNYFYTRKPEWLYKLLFKFYYRVFAKWLKC